MNTMMVTLLLAAFLVLVPARVCAKGLEIHVGSYDELSELRIKTDQVRQLPDGGSEAVYVLKKPAANAVFVNVRLYLSHGDTGFTLRTDDIRLTGSGVVSHPFDWFSEEGLREVRGETVAFDAQGILNLTLEVKRALLDEATLYVLDTKAGSLTAIRGETQGTLQIAQVEAAELTELRVQTDTYRRNEGDIQPVYVLRKPEKDMAFVNFRVYLVVTDGSYRFRREDLRVTAGGKSWVPFEWYQENGLAEDRATVFTVENQALFNFTIEIPREALATGTLKIGIVSGGALADLLP
jgi:hypothetical protein